MAIINQSNILNLQPGITAPVVVHMSEGDSGTKLSFKLIDGARAWTDPGNVVAAVHGRRQDGTQFGPYACTISGDVVSFQTDAAIAAVAGSGIAQIVLTDGNGNTAGSANFAVMVERATFPMGVTYTNDKSVYEAILRYVQTIPAQVTRDYTTKIEAETSARIAADTSLQNQITAEVDARANQDSVLSARMDEFTKLPDGSLSTAADAELVDIRVKADGTTAATAGNAVREQVSDLKSTLTQIDGLYTGQEITFENDKYINVSGNNISNNDYFALTYPINVMEGATLTITTYTSKDAGMMFFKSNGQKDRCVDLSNSTTNALVTATVVVPQGCASARFTCAKSHKNDFKIVTSSVIEEIIDKIEDADKRFDAIQNAILRYSDTELGQANEWQNATITTLTGYPQKSTTRILSKYITRIKSFTANDGYKCRVFGFGRNYNYLGTWTGTAFKTNRGDYSFSSLDFKPLYMAGAVYFRIVIMKTSDDTISTSDCVNVTFSFEEMLKTPIRIREPFTLGNYEVTDQLNAIHGNGYTCINVGIAETFYFRGQFSFPKNIHSTSGQYQLIGLDNIAKIWFDKAVTTEKTVQPIEPVPIYNAGFRIGSIIGGEADVTLYPDGWRRDLLLGEDAMAFRFAGDCAIAGNQDIRLSVDADYITIYHSTDDSIIHKFTKSSYSTMRSLYEAMSNEVQSGDLTDFEIKWLNLDNLTPNDIIECDVALIGQYPTATEGVTRYDAFPFYFTTKQGNGKRYDVEVLIDQNNPTYNIQILINGYPIFKRKMAYPIFKRNLPITIYDQSGNGITTHEIEIGVEPKSKYPTIANIFIEGIDIGLNATGIKSSSRHVLGLADYMAKLEREYIAMDDIIRVFDGGLKTKSNYLWIMHIDDARHDHLNFATNAELRQELIAHGIYPSAAYMLNTGDMSAEEKRCMEATRKVGFDYHIHSAYTDGTLNINLYSYDQLNANVTEAIEKFIDYFGAVPVVWGIHSGSLEYRISRYLKNKGFRFIFGGISETDNALNEITRYGCKRASALDSVVYSTYDKLYKSY